MNIGSAIFLKHLLQAAARDPGTLTEEERREQDDQLRAAMLLHCSHSPDNCRSAGMVTFKRLPAARGCAAFAGIALESCGTAVSDILQELTRLQEVPEVLMQKWPAMKIDDLITALHIASLMLTMFEWTERPDVDPDLWPDGGETEVHLSFGDKARSWSEESLMGASLRCFRKFPETGER